MPWDADKLKKFSDVVEQAGIHSRDQAASWQRWVLASCFSVNGGAILGILNFSGIDECSRRWAVGAFAVGLLFSIIFGMASAAVARQLGWFYSGSSWNISKRTFARAESDDSEAERLDAEMLGILRDRERRVQWIQYPSLAFFIIGLSIVIKGLQ